MEDWLVVHSGYHTTELGLQLLSGIEWQKRKAAFEQRWSEPDPALAIPIDDQYWHQMRAMESEHSANTRAALNHLDSLLEHTPDNWSLHARKGRVLTLAGATEQATRAYTKAEMHDSENLQNWLLHHTDD